MALEKFHYDHDGREIILPKFRTMPIGIVRKSRKLGETEQLFSIIEAMADADALAVIDDMDVDGLKDLFQKWQADSGVTVGESSASAT